MEFHFHGVPAQGAGLGRYGCDYARRGAENQLIFGTVNASTEASLTRSRMSVFSPTVAGRAAVADHQAMASRSGGELWRGNQAGSRTSSRWQAEKFEYAESHVVQKRSRVSLNERLDTVTCKFGGYTWRWIVVAHGSADDPIQRTSRIFRTAMGGIARIASSTRAPVRISLEWLWRSSISREFAHNLYSQKDRAGRTSCRGVAARRSSALRQNHVTVERNRIRFLEQQVAVNTRSRWERAL